MKKKTSLKDIAEKVGVSVTLVSYVLNNKMEGRINKEVAQKIRDTAKKLNYRTNQIAKSLKTNKTNTIGLIVADISNPFHSALARIIEDEAEKFGYTVIFGSSDESLKKSDKLIDIFLNRQIDGLIYAASENAEAQLEDLIKQKIPFVLVDRYFPGVNCSYVALDNYSASFKAVEYIIGKGRKRIAMIGYKSDLRHLRDRKRGYIAALKKHKLETKSIWMKEIKREDELQQVEKAMMELMAEKTPIDAILFGANRIATAGLKYISALPIKIPDELLIVSFDESESLDLFRSPIDYIKQPLRELGEESVRLLLQSIGKKSVITQVNLQAELVIRNL